MTATVVRVVAVLGTLVCLSRLGAQEQGLTAEATSGSDPTLAETAGVPDPGGAAPAEAQKLEDAAASNLVRDTLLRDIETASYYELVAWCRELELQDSGARQVLQRRLIEFYRLEEVRRQASGEPGRVLEIRSAKETEYFTVEQVGEDYVLLQGDVLVELREKEAIHRIRAERILLNQSASLLTAEGGIEYTLVKGSEEEVFRGEKLTFDIESWEGVFFRGGIEADRPIGGKQVRFRFEGETISRLEGDTVVMDRGTITSCEDREQPHYQVRARKIWVLAPGEWAILSAVLYVGRIPILYLPFYFHPGDEFFFHPALGIREREGYFLQTTTYLVGQKPPRANALSFLAAAEESTVEFRRQIRGLFLRPVEGETVDRREDRFLKILLDAYSRLGVFAGVSGSFPPHTSFKGGLGLSRTIYEEEGIYVPYKSVSGEYQSIWNRSWLFGLPVPFRYGVEANWSLGKGAYKFGGKFELFSDPTFVSDFYSRSEEIGLTRIAGLEEGTATSTPAEKQALSWELSTSADFSRLSSSALLKTLSVPNLNASLLWQSREVPVGLLDAEDPARRFYYPASVKLPSASAQITGELLRLPRERPAGRTPPAPQPSAERTEELRAPASRPPTAPVAISEARALKKGGAVDLESLRPPLVKPDLRATLEKTPVSLAVSYQVRPNLKLEQTFDSDDWSSPAEVDGDLKFTSLDTSAATSLDYDLSILEGLAAVRGAIQSTGTYRTSIDQGYGDAENWAQLTLGDYRYTQLNLKNTLNASVYPLAGRGVFGKSSLSYSLAWTMFRYNLEDSVQLYDLPVYTARGPEWNPDGFSQNSVKGVLSWRGFNQDNTLSLGVQLPPRDTEISGDVVFRVWLLTTTINSVFREGDWNENIPVVIQEQLEIIPEVRLTQELRLDAVEGIATRSLSSLRLWGLSAAFTADRLQPTRDSPFEPSLASASYRLAEQEVNLWKYRIGLQASLSSAWSMNLRDYRQNSLDFSFTFKMFVHKFLELSFTTVSYNNRTYRYFPWVADSLGVGWVNPLTDLLRSFNFANEQDRLDSAFKLKSIGLTLIHHLHDWDLTLQYSGMPQLTLDDPDTGAYDPRYEWKSSFSILLQWIPIPELRNTVRGEKLGEDPWDYTLRGDQP